MRNFTFDKTISVGNLISWFLMLSGFIFGYAALMSDVRQNKQDVIEAKRNIIEQREDINKLKTDTEVTKIKVIYIEKKVDEASLKLDQVLRQTK